MTCGLPRFLEGNGEFLDVIAQGGLAGAKNGSVRGGGRLLDRAVHDRDDLHRFVAAGVRTTTVSPSRAFRS
jgi:hypothetical protein